MKQNTELAADHRPPITDHLYIAVDLGAGSGRVFLCDTGEKFSLAEIRRFQYPPIEKDGRLRWDFREIFREIKNGLREAGIRARELNRRIRSIGVDSWAVDYGLLGENGELLADPVCYRDQRTVGAMEKVFERISKSAIFEKTGIQFLNFNTIFQLAAEDQIFLEKAGKLLLLPDLINYFLTGKTTAEYTNATTTQLVNRQTGVWDREITEKLKLPGDLFSEIIAAGTDLGFLKPELARELQLENVRVVAPATHDTASAVVGAPLEKDWAYISSGTWSLVGVERDASLINDAVARENFTNEGGAYGTVRFLKNVMGLWIFEACRKEWKAQGIETDYAALLREVARIEKFQGFIYPDDERFLNPQSMLRAVAEQFAETGQRFDANPAFVAKVILDSLAFRYAAVLRTIEELTGTKIKGVQIVGGGGRNEYLNRMTASAANVTVKAGLAEATVTGNALVQAIAAGRFRDLAESRRYVAENVRLAEYAAQASPEFGEAQRKYREIESFYLNRAVVV